MILDAKSGLSGVLIDLETGQEIRWARWANTDTGDYQAFRSDPKEARRRGISPTSLLYRGRTRLRFVASATASAPVKPTPQTPKPSRPPQVGRRCVVTPGRGCQAYGCLRDAEWYVADEQALPEERGSDGRQYEQARVVGSRFLCPWHYSNPRTIHPDGSSSPIEVAARPN